MRKYLDPKADIVFKKIFGEHPHLLKSFLNAVLPLSPTNQIVELEYLPAEQIPEIPLFKRTITDVKCKDQQGKIFIVEMQIEWTDSFMQRLLFGTARAYVKQLRVGEAYHLLNPVYGLGLIDSVFDEKTPNWYHHYGLVSLKNHDEEIINGLTLIFVELPKFKTNSTEEKKLKILWLRFMREIGRGKNKIDPALLEVPEIREALALAEEAAYTPAELEAYEEYWDTVSCERTLVDETRAKALAEGREVGREEEKLKVARRMREDGLSDETILKYTKLTEMELKQL